MTSALSAREAVSRWAIVLLIFMAAGLGLGQYQTIRAARDSEAAAVRAEAAALRADVAATQASTALTAAIAASQEDFPAVVINAAILTIQNIQVLLCSTEDPARQAKCAELGIEVP